MKSMFHKSTFILALIFMISSASSSAQVAVVSGGAGAPDGTGVNGNNNAGGNSTGLGCGGGGASWWGGSGGAGKYGGGGGGAAGYFSIGSINWSGGDGGQGVVVIAYYNGATFLNSVVLTTGTSVTVGAGVTSAKVWAIGGGGGGGGSTENDGTSGGSGGAGGVAYVTKTVSQGNTINYSIGSGGLPGHGATIAGTSGGNTSVTIAGTTLFGNGGGPGLINNISNAAGGTHSGGDGGANGGTGYGRTGDLGGGGGGAIGGANGTENVRSGGTGASSNEISGLFAVCSSATIQNTPSLTSFTPTSGLTATVVTITGSGFTGATAVRVGGISVTSFTVNSATQIVATLASTSVTGSVSVTLPYVTVSKSIYFFTAPSPPSISSFSPTTATTGDLVTINGSNFLGVTSVSFGGTPAISFTVNSNYVIMAVVAAGTSGNVSVSSSAGTTSYAGFTYTAPPTPNVSSFTPTSASTGQTVNITGTNFSGAIAVSFGGTAASSFTVNSATSISAIVGAGTTGSVSVTTSTGTSSQAGFTFVDPIQASGITFSGIQETQMTIGWTNGNGTKRSVFVKAGAGAGTAAPSNNTTYAASSAFGSGAQIGSTGWYCVYNNTGNTVTLIGLVLGTPYTAQVYEYNGNALAEKYNLTTATENPKSQSTSGSTVPSDPTSISATNNPICNGFSTQLAANNVDGTVYWYTGSCGGTQVTTGNTYTVSPVTTTTYYARNYNNSQYSPGCASVSVTVNQPSFTGTQPTVASLYVTGSNVKWYASSTGGSPLATSLTLVDGNHYFASQTVNSVESTARLDITATVDPTPCAPTGAAAQDFCFAATVADLTATVTGSNIRWYTTSGGATALSPTTVLSAGTYYATQTIDCTESASRLAVAVSLTPLTTPSIGGPSTGYTATPGYIYNATNAAGTKMWTVTGGTILLGQGTDSIKVQWTSTGTQTITIQITNGSCQITNSKQVSVTPTP